MGDGGGFKGDGEMMDTPARSRNNQITGSDAKVEDSPVFNFLNSLSPIQSMKSTNSSQMINPLITSPLVFASPHVTSSRESRFLRRHQLSDPSRPEFASDGGNNADKIKETCEISQNITEQQEIRDPKPSNVESAGDPSYGSSKLVVGYEESFTYYCNNLNSNAKPSSSFKAERLAEYTSSSSGLVLSVEDASQKVLYGNETIPGGISEFDQSREPTAAEWETLMAEASEFLNFDSPNNPESGSKSDNACFIGGLPPGNEIGEGSNAENLLTQHGEGSDVVENAESLDAIAGLPIDNPDQNMDCEHLSSFYRGVRRRCLVFEMGGAGRKHVEKIPNSTASVMLRSDGNTSSNAQHPVRKSIAGNHAALSLVPGIGLHLNTLARTPVEHKFTNNGASISAKLLTGQSSLRISRQAEPRSSVFIDPPTTGIELVGASSEREPDLIENSSILPVEETSQVSQYLANEDINQSSPKKKRRKSEQSEEAGSCKRCNCKKSKCLKLYCECFAAGVYCVEPCACIDCFNKPIHVETVLATRKQIESRNPLAFAPRVIKGPETFSETMDNSSKTPASARHKRGCNCKKSGCLKKYCECYQGGVGCSINCRCEGCKNAFGRKDGFGVMGMQVELEEYAKDTTEKEAPGKLFHKSAIQNDIEQNIDSMTPSHFARESFQPTISSKKKPPRSSGTLVATSSGYHINHTYLKQPSFFHPPAMLDNKHHENTGEDGIPEMLLGSSPISGIKLSSPSKKRISPPHSIGGGMRKSRKLILQSIPSFPSLGNNQ